MHRNRPLQTKIGAHRWSSCASRFLFSVFAKAAVPEPPLPRRRGGANQNAAPCQKKKRVWNGGIGTLCRGVSQPRLDLTNLSVTTGYHSLSCLSSPDLKFFCGKSFFSKNWTLALRNLSRLCVKSIRSLLLFEKNTDIIFLRLLGVCICLRLAAHSYAPRKPPRSGFSKAH